jgi:hypothetical protein
VACEQLASPAENKTRATPMRKRLENEIFFIVASSLGLNPDYGTVK